MYKRDNFEKYQKNIIGYNDNINGKFQHQIYADWAGSGKVYKPIEENIINNFAPYYSNLHSIENHLSDFIGDEYYNSKAVILKHFDAL